MVINLTARSRVYDGNGFRRHDHEKHHAAFILEEQQHIFDVTLAVKVSAEIIRPNKKTLKPLFFDPREVTPVDCNNQESCATIFHVVVISHI